jgi:hypothetical protein
MTPAEWREFLLFGTRTAKVATVRSSGYPHVAPAWPVLDGDEMVFTAGKTSIKGKDLLREPHLMICVDDILTSFFRYFGSILRRKL